MFEIVYMKADYEPWWMFDDWEEWVQERQTYTTLEEAERQFETMIEEWKGRYEHFELRKRCFAAFWTTNEICFCEDCDDDLQLFHGLILMKDGIPIVKE